MTRRLPWLLCAALALTACVDETGYECPDGDLVASEDLCVDETGYLEPDLVSYTAPAPLDDVPRPVTLVGRPGALPGSGTLEVERTSGAVDAVVGPDEDGAFLVSLTAALEDELLLRFTPDDGVAGTDSLLLDDTLAGVAAPAVGTTQLVTTPDENGEVTVFLSNLLDAAPPFVVFNEDALEPVILFADTVGDVSLPAGIGQNVCVFHVRPDEDASSTQVCQTVPAA